MTKRMTRAEAVAYVLDYGFNGYKDEDPFFQGTLTEYMAQKHSLDPYSDYDKCLELACKALDVEIVAEESQEAPATTRDFKPDINKYETLSMESLTKHGSILGDQGIDLKAMQRYNVGFSAHHYVTSKNDSKADPQYLIIPTGKDAHNAIPLNPKAESRHRSNVFNLESLDSKKPVFVVMDELDALSIVSASYLKDKDEPEAEALAVVHKNNLGQVINQVKSHKPEAPLIVCFSDDWFETELRRAKVEFITADLCGDSFSSVLERIGRDKAGLIGVIRQTLNEATRDPLERYKQHNLSAELDRYLDDIKNSVVETPMPTNFKTLDEILGGGLYQGLYCIGGMSSTGKTAIALQMADNIAKQGFDVLYISLEMTRRELFCRIIHRHLYQQAKSSGDKFPQSAIPKLKELKRNPSLMNKDHQRLVQSELAKIKEYADHLIIREGMGDISADAVRGFVSEHISKTKNRPLVIIDYMQILSPHDVRATDKQNMDYNVVELKRISNDYKIPVLTISSFSRAKYKGEADMSSFKESGTIEYTASVLLGLQYRNLDPEAKPKDYDRALKTEQKKNPRELKLSVLKNRDGEQGDTIKFDFYSGCDYFEDLGILREVKTENKTS